MDRSRRDNPDPHEVADRIAEEFKGSTVRMRIIVFDGDERTPPRVEGVFQLKRPSNGAEVATRLKRALEGG